MHKVEEKSSLFSLRKLRKPRERERENLFAFCFLNFPIQKGRELFYEKAENTWRERKRKGGATFLLHLGYARSIAGGKVYNIPELDQA